MKLVKESLQNFKRGQDTKSALSIGESRILKELVDTEKFHDWFRDWYNYAVHDCDDWNWEYNSETATIDIFFYECGDDEVEIPPENGGPEKERDPAEPVNKWTLEDLEELNSHVSLKDTIEKIRNFIPVPKF